MKRSMYFLGLAVFGALAVSDAAAWSYSSPTAQGDCADIPDNLGTGFKSVPLVSRGQFPAGSSVSDTIPSRVMKMALDTVGGKTEIYFTEKYGKVRLYRANYDGSDSSLTTLGFVSVDRSFQEDGLWSIALDPAFRINGFLYVMYATSNNLNSGSTVNTQPSATNGWRISRFTVDHATRKFVSGSEKVVIHIPAGTGNRWHTGGSLRFDKAGNLYATLGDNETLMMGAGNTADLRGGIIRIRPAANGGYTIPSGNFGQYWAAQFTATGRTGLAAQYLDTNKVRPEIYVKGSRNPYSFGIDPWRTGLIAWSECGPDSDRGEEHNLSNHPAFGGWPFWAGNGIRQTGKATSYDQRGEPSYVGSPTTYSASADWTSSNPTTLSTLNPVNTWPGRPDSSLPRLGVDSFPAMHIPAWATHTNSGCAQGGPIIRYDGRVNNPKKMPPHLDNVWIFTNFTSGNYQALRVDTATGTAVGSSGGTVLATPTDVFLVATYPRGSTTAPNNKPSFGNSIDFQQGPDGALYGLNHGAGCCDGNSGGQSVYAGIFRVEYTGNCQDPGRNPGVVGLDNSGLVRKDVDWLKVGSTMFTVLAQGKHESAILDVNGRTLQTFRGEGPTNYNIPKLGASSIYLLRVKTEQGIAIRSISSGL
jgi:cytochrome c